jgi:tetratricopeptide (TPR) repeat protein
VRERHERLARHFAPLDPARALDHAVQAHAWTDVVALLEKHGDELLQSGYTDRVAGWLARLPGRCSASATLRLLSATVADRRGDGPQALAMYQQLLSVSEREVQAMLLERIMECMVRMGHVAGMAHWADEALALCPPDDVGLQSRMLSWQAGAAFLLGQEADTALQALHRAHDMAYRSGDPVAIWAASAVLGLGGGQFRDLEHSADVLARGARCMADNGYMSKAAHLWINRGLLLTLSGRFEEAAVDLRQATSVPHGDTWLDAALLSAQALLALGRRAMEDAAPFVARLADMAVPPQIRPWALRAQVIYHAGQRQFEKAERLGREMMEALGPVGSRGAYAPACRLDLAAMYARQGRTATALRQAEEALEISQAMGSLVWEAKAKAALADLKGQAAQHPPAELEIFTLGRFAIFRHGRDITTQVCGRAKVGDLLKMFLASPDLAVPVDAAIGCLWPGADPSRGRHDLATQVSRLRRHLGPEAVYYRDQAYHLSTGRVKIDFTELLDWLAQARTALQEGNVVAAERICGWAADLYRGDFLPDDCTPPGLDACRHRLRAQYLETVQVVTNSVSNQPG